LQARLAQAGRKRAEKNYSVDRYVSRLDELYRRFSRTEVDGSTGVTTLESQN